jgi:hypothetical protein
MGHANSRSSEMVTNDRYAAEIEYDIATVDGEIGQRLAVIQVESILEVVEWFSRHPSRPSTTT